MAKRPTLASLPLDQILDAARLGGISVANSPDSLQRFFVELRSEWLQENIDHADGQTDDEFGEILNKVCDAWGSSFDEEVGARTKRLDAAADAIMSSLNDLRALHALTCNQLENNLIARDDFLRLVGGMVERIGIRLEAGHEATGRGTVGNFDELGAPCVAPKGGCNA